MLEECYLSQRLNHGASGWSGILNNRTLYSWDWPSTGVGGKWAPGSLPAVRVLGQSQRAHAGFTALNGCLQDDRAAEDTASFNQMATTGSISVAREENTLYLSDWDDDRVWILFSSCLRKTQERSDETKRCFLWSDRHVTAERLWRRLSRLTCAQQDSVSKATYGTGTATWWQYSTLERIKWFQRIYAYF